MKEKFGIFAYQYEFTAISKLTKSRGGENLLSPVSTAFIKLGIHKYRISVLA